MKDELIKMNELIQYKRRGIEEYYKEQMMLIMEKSRIEKELEKKRKKEWIVELRKKEKELKEERDREMERVRWRGDQREERRKLALEELYEVRRGGGLGRAESRPSMYV